ncbi:hypothetical protein S40293_09288 [Stachybotrys chartarum IBT 40293]|nr:hypothetical protein S40293_09288 [Stachybotrys chartarum IBT 40293]
MIVVGRRPSAESVESRVPPKAHGPRPASHHPSPQHQPRHPPLLPRGPAHPPPDALDAVERAGVEGGPGPAAVPRVVGPRRPHGDGQVAEAAHVRHARPVAARERLGRSPRGPAVGRPRRVVRRAGGRREVAAHRDAVRRVPEPHREDARRRRARDLGVRHPPGVAVAAVEDAARVHAARCQVPPPRRRRDASAARREAKLALERRRHPARVDNRPALPAVRRLHQPEHPVHGVADRQPALRRLKVEAVVEGRRLRVGEDARPGLAAVRRRVDARVGAGPDGQDHGAVRRPCLHVAELDLRVVGRQRRADRRPCRAAVERLEHRAS